MDAATRVRVCRLIEKINQNKGYANLIMVKDVTVVQKTDVNVSSKDKY